MVKGNWNVSSNRGFKRRKIVVWMQLLEDRQGMPLKSLGGNQRLGMCLGHLNKLASCFFFGVNIHQNNSTGTQGKRGEANSWTVHELPADWVDTCER